MPHNHLRVTPFFHRSPRVSPPGSREPSPEKGFCPSELRTYPCFTTQAGSADSKMRMKAHYELAGRGRDNGAIASGTNPIPRRGVFGQGHFPTVSVFDDRRQIVKHRFPSETEQALIIRYERHGIPTPSFGNTLLKRFPGYAFYRPHDFIHRIAPAIAAIDGDAFT